MKIDIFRRAEFVKKSLIPKNMHRSCVDTGHIWHHFAWWNWHIFVGFKIKNKPQKS